MEVGHVLHGEHIVFPIHPVDLRNILGHNGPAQPQAGRLQLIAGGRETVAGLPGGADVLLSLLDDDGPPGVADLEDVVNQSRRILPLLTDDTDLQGALPRKGRIMGAQIVRQIFSGQD